MYMLSAPTWKILAASSASAAAEGSSSLRHPNFFSCFLFSEVNSNMDRDYFLFRNLSPALPAAEEYQQHRSWLDFDSPIKPYLQNSTNNTFSTPVSPIWEDYERVVDTGETIYLKSATALPKLVITSTSGAHERTGATGVTANSEDFSISWVSVFLMAVLIVVTIVGNALVCLSVVLVRKLRKPQNYLLVSLATSDLFVAIFVMPFAIVVELYQSHWPLTPGLCDFWVSGTCMRNLLLLCSDPHVFAL